VVVFCLQLCVNKNTSRYARFHYIKARHHSFIPSSHRLLNPSSAAFRKHAILVTCCNVCAVKWQRVTWRNLSQIMASELFFCAGACERESPQRVGAFW
jgi:hypothetical protein